jgi:hypothetical protein
LDPGKFKALSLDLDLPFRLEELPVLLGETYDEICSRARKTRLSLILEVDRRAKSVGFEVAPDDVEAFKDEFMKLKFADTMGWQETAHLAASPLNAKRILDAIASMSVEMRDADVPDGTGAR